MECSKDKKECFEVKMERCEKDVKNEKKVIIIIFRSVVLYANGIQNFHYKSLTTVFKLVYLQAVCCHSIR